VGLGEVREDAADGPELECGGAVEADEGTLEREVCGLVLAEKSKDPVGEDGQTLLLGKGAVRGDRAAGEDTPRGVEDGEPGVGEARIKREGTWH